MSSPVIYSAFEPANVSFGKADVMRNGGKIVNLSYPGSRRIQLQTPTVSLPFGVNEPFKGGNGGDVQSYSVDLSFRGYDENAAMGKFLEKMRAIDALVLKKAHESSVEWFGKQTSAEVIQELYRPLVRDAKDPQYAPTMKVKIPVVGGVPSASFFDEDRNPVQMDYLSKGTTAKFIIEVSSVWFVNKNFGVTWRLVQALVVSRPSTTTGPGGFAFADDPSDEASPAFTATEASAKFI